MADDNEELALNIAEMLEMSGYQAVTAFDGSGAISVARRECPDFVILDVRMPDIDGLAAFRQIKAFAPRIEGILMTALAVNELVEEAARLGIHATLKKPFAYETLLDLLEQHKGHVAG